jgi:acyl dehydratase
VDTLENYTYNELHIGQTASYSRTLTEQDILLFAIVSGDVNPVHLDAEFARSTLFRERIAHGMYTGALVSAALALRLPGPGTIYLSQSLQFRKPVLIGDRITIELTIVEKKDDKNVVTLNCSAINQDGKTVAKGPAEVIAPSEKLRMPMPQLPSVTVG